MKLLRTLIDNRNFQRICLPLAIWNMRSSYILTMKEKKIIVDTINMNSEFFSSIATLGFVPKSHFGELISTMPFEQGMTIQDIQDIAQKTIIGVIIKFVHSEDLLGIINVDCKIDNDFVVTTIQPKSLKMFLGDCFDTVFATLMTILYVGIGYLLFNYLTIF